MRPGERHGGAERAGAPEVAAALADRIADLACELAGDPTDRGQGGRELRFRRRGSLGVMIAGERRGQWFDHEAGEGGDALDLVRHLRGGSTSDALRWASAWLGLAPGTVPPPRRTPPPASPEPEHDADERARIALAARIWREAVEPHGTPVETYFASRGLELPVDVRCIRFHPTCPRGAERLPAMVAVLQDVRSNQATGVHRTFLKPDGSGKVDGKAKAMLGRAGGAVVKLVDDADATIGLGLAEGIETALAVIGAGWRPVWAAGSAGAIRTFPVLDGIGSLTLFADGDQAGLTAARECARRWAAAGREAFIEAAPATRDFADVLAGAA